MFADKLIALRKSKGLTQKDCADKFDVTLRAWQTYEQGVSEPKYELLCKIADMFNVSLDYLLGRTEIKAMAGTTPAEQLDVTAAEQEIIRRYAEFPEDLRLLLLDTIRKLVGLPDDVGEVRPVIVFTRCHRMKASAGAGFDLDNDDEWRDKYTSALAEAIDSYIATRG